MQLHARLYGRGPTRAKTYITSDYALSVLEEIFTPAERTLIAAGKGEHVQATRMAFQEAVQAEFVAIVEEITGRGCRALISQVHLETGIGDRALPVRAAGQATAGARRPTTTEGDPDGGRDRARARSRYATRSPARSSACTRSPTEPGRATWPST